MTGFAIECLAKITVLLALAWAVTAGLRRSSAATRHCVWATAIFACLTLPGLMACLPEWRVRSVTVRPTWIEIPQPVVANVPKAWDELPVSNPTRPLPDPKRPPAPRKSPPWSRAKVAGALWAAGVAVGLIRLIGGYLRVRRLTAEPFPSFAIPGVRVLRAIDPSVMPLTWGLLRPRVVFPAGALEWPEQRRNHVLAHELAHIRRRDWAAQIAAELLRALLWFHPLTWLAARQLRQEAERACDDAVLAQGANAPDYADDVVLLARTLHSPPGGVSSAVAAAHPTDFERRVSAMLNPLMNRRPVTRLTLTLNLLLAATVLGPLAVLAGGQEIRGKVIDPGTGQGIPDADINVSITSQVGPSVFNSKTSAKLKTDAQGEFVYKTTDFGEYFVTATKEGYGGSPRPGALPNMFSSSALTLNANNPTRDVQFSLGRRGTLAARFVDAETGQPIPSLMFRPFAVGTQNGSLVSSWGGTPVTDPEGRLRFEAVPGNYMLEVLPPLWSIKSAGNGVVAAHADRRILREFTAEDADKTDLDYRFRFLPGGPGLESVLPVAVASGGIVDIGTFRLKKEPFYRARVKIGGACTTGEKLKLTEMIVMQPTSPSSEKSTEFGEVACGSEVLITGLQPREYALEASTGTAPNLRRGLLAFTVGESNLSVSLEVKNPRALEGRIVMSKDAGTVDFSKIAVSAMVMPGIVRPLQDMLPAKLDGTGHFRLENATTWRRRVAVNGLDSGHYVKEIRYQGQPLPGTLFDFTGDGELEIEIDSQPAAVTGTVRQSDKAVAQAHVILTRWPLTAGDPSFIRHLNADGSGYFQAAGLAPGEYRIFAVMPDDQSAAGEPAAWQRLLSRAEKLTLSRGGTQSVTLRTSDPSR